MAARTRKDAGSNAGTDALEPAGDSDESPESSSFEASLERLEAIVDQLEAGDLTLEASLEAFEAGVALAGRCAAELEQTERRIEVLVEEGGHWVTRPFQEVEEDD